MTLTVVSNFKTFYYNTITNFYLFLNLILPFYDDIIITMQKKAYTNIVDENRITGIKRKRFLEFINDEYRTKKIYKIIIDKNDTVNFIVREDESEDDDDVSQEGSQKSSQEGSQKSSQEGSRKGSVIDVPDNSCVNSQTNTKNDSYDDDINEEIIDDNLENDIFNKYNSNYNNDIDNKIPVSNIRYA